MTSRFKELLRKAMDEGDIDQDDLDDAGIDEDMDDDGDGDGKDEGDKNQNQRGRVVQKSLVNRRPQAAEDVEVDGAVLFEAIQDIVSAQIAPVLKAVKEYGTMLKAIVTATDEQAEMRDQAGAKLDKIEKALEGFSEPMTLVKSLAEAETEKAKATAAKSGSAPDGDKKPDLLQKGTTGDPLAEGNGDKLTAEEAKETAILISKATGFVGRRIEVPGFTSQLVSDVYAGKANRETLETLRKGVTAAEAVAKNGRAQEGREAVAA